MGKVKDQLYVVRNIVAQSIRDNFNHSQNKPFLIQGVDKNTGQLGYFVLKPTKGQRMYNGASMRELIASLLAIELDIPVPEPVIIEISPEFATLYSNKTYYEVLYNSIGNNFGTVYLEDLSTWTYAHYNNKLLFSALQRTFVFDVFIENTDRNKDKPNMLVGHDEIYLIDHEIAFSFADLLLYNNPTPWILTENDCALARKHLFYDFLKEKNFCSEKLIEKMANLDKDFWKSVDSYLPADWLHSKYDIIKNHLTLRITNLEEFQKGIERLLV